MECRDVNIFIASIDVQLITTVIATIAEASEASEVSLVRLRRMQAETKVVAIAVVAANYTYLRNNCSPPLPAIFDFFLGYCVVISCIASRSLPLYSAGYDPEPSAFQYLSS